LSELAGQGELVLIVLKPKAGSFAWAFGVVNNMEDLVCKTSLTFFADFLFSEEEEVFFKSSKTNLL